MTHLGMKLTRRRTSSEVNQHPVHGAVSGGTELTGGRSGGNSVRTSTNVPVTRGEEADGCPNNGEYPRQGAQEQAVILHPARCSFVIRQDEVCADGDDEDPVVGLDHEDLRHEAVEAAEAALLRSADVSPVDVHGCR